MQMLEFWVEVVAAVAVVVLETRQIPSRRGLELRVKVLLVVQGLLLVAAPMALVAAAVVQVVAVVLEVTKSAAQVVLG
tara:strand:+ start:76 stop:309 length:234 start_codon:yes stop_codon:yes gene_type:complete